MMSVSQLGYLGLSVSNVGEWERFATQVLGLQTNGREADGSLFLRMDEYHHRFIVHPTGKDDLAYIGWEVATEEALQALAAQLTASGVTVQSGTPEEAEARRVAGLIKFHDPSGIASEVFYGPLVTFDKPFQSPRPISGFKTGEQGLGHFVVFMEDLDRSLHFYRDVLGMRISDFVRFTPAPGVTLKIAFLHCNPRHHSLAFAAMPQAPKRLHHFMLQLTSLDDVGSTYYLCQNQQVPITMNLGKHTNDHMVSFYLRTPSGFAVEYGWGAREVIFQGKYRQFREIPDQQAPDAAVAVQQRVVAQDRYMIRLAVTAPAGTPLPEPATDTSFFELECFKHVLNVTA